MIIAFDYDDTYTRDPRAWQTAIMALKAAGHRVIGVTTRYEREAASMDAAYGMICDATYFTGRQQKRKWLAERDIFPHVWIDDTPEFIVDIALIGADG